MSPEQRAAAQLKSAATRAAKKLRIANSPTLAKLRIQYPEQSGRIDALASGSLQAAITMMCVTCSGGSYFEAKLCTAVGCPLFEHRPGAGQNSESEESEPESEPES